MKILGVFPCQISVDKRRKKILKANCRNTWQLGIIMSNECLKVTSATPLQDWYFQIEHYREYAIKCKQFLDKIPELIIYESRVHTKRNHVCWYYGLRDERGEKVCIILRPEIRKDDICFQFQSAKNVPQDLLKCGEKENTTGWLNILYTNYREVELKDITEGYLQKVRDNWNEAQKHCKKRRPCTYCKKA
jgi:hypothetical protein